MKAAITDHHYADISNAIAVMADAGIDVVVGSCRSEDDAIALGRDADVVINQHLAITARILDAWPNCRGLVHFGKGVDNIDVAAATRRGICVANVPDANWDEVSNHVLALLLGWARGLLVFDRDVRAGGWTHRIAIPRSRLAGQVLGIIGLGDIGHVLARKARGLGLEVLAHTRSGERSGDVAFVGLDELLRRSDYVSLHVPLTDATVHLIGERELSLMKPRAFIINTSRGRVVDQTALVAALKARRIAGAGLDVTDPEPPARDDPLLTLDNVILTPHVAWYSEESREHVTVQAAREAVRIAMGEAPLSPVNPDVVPRRVAVRPAGDNGRSESAGVRHAPRVKVGPVCAACGSIESGFASIGELADGVTAGAGADCRDQWARGRPGRLPARRLARAGDNLFGRGAAAACAPKSIRPGMKGAIIAVPVGQPACAPVRHPHRAALCGARRRRIRRATCTSSGPAIAGEA